MEVDCPKTEESKPDPPPVKAVKREEEEEEDKRDQIKKQIEASEREHLMDQDNETTEKGTVHLQTTQRAEVLQLVLFQHEAYSGGGLL